jgi:hypothetical protein
MSENNILEMLTQITYSLREGFDGLGKRLSVVEQSLQHCELWSQIQHNAHIPGIEKRARDLSEQLLHLSKGDIILHWRAEVYEHDRELIDTLRQGESFRAVVPPLARDSFDDIEFTEYIGTQIDAAKRGVEIIRIYVFSSERERQERLSDDVLKRHLDDLALQSRNIKLYTAITPRYKHDIVFFGESRCSVSNSDVDIYKFLQFEVSYTSQASKLQDCEKQWKRLMKAAQPYKGGANESHNS